MVQREHRMRLAPAKICLKLDYGIAASSAKAPKSADQQLLQSMSHESALKKVDRLAVLVRGFASVHLCEVSCELRLLESAGCNIRMRCNNFSPWLQTWRRLTLGGIVASFRVSVRVCSAKLSRSSSCFMRWTSAA